MRFVTPIARAFFGVAGFLSSTLPYCARALTTAQTGLTNTSTNAGLKVAAGFHIEEFVGSIINAALSIIGVVFLVLMVYGGLLWMLSEGDDTKIGKARGLIFHSIVGLILVLSAYAITNFVVGAIISQTVQP